MDRREGLVLAALLLALAAGAAGQQAAHRRRDEGGSAQVRRSCRCDNITACMLWRSEKTFSAHLAATADFQGNLERASQTGRRAEVQHMAARFTATFKQLHLQQVKVTRVVLQRLEALKQKADFASPQRFVNLARNVNQAIVRAHARFEAFAAQVVDLYRRAGVHLGGLARG